MKGKSQKAAFVKIIHIQRAEKARHKHTIDNIQKRRFEKLPVLNDPNKSRLIHYKESVRAVSSMCQVNWRGQPRGNDLQFYSDITLEKWLRDGVGQGIGFWIIWSCLRPTNGRWRWAS